MLYTLLIELGISAAIFVVMVWMLVRGLKRDVSRQSNVAFCSLALLALIWIISSANGLIALGANGLLATDTGYALGFEDAIFMVSSQFSGFGITFCNFLLPVLVIGFVPVIISNIFLIKYEGYRITNLLGVALFCILVISFVALVAFSDLLIDRYITSIIEGVAVDEGLVRTMLILQCVNGYMIAYLQCVFISIIICSLYVVKKKAKMDKDFVIILGCKVKDDGTPSTILARRIDRAIEFAEQQYRKTKKQVTFMASGGKGHDETISEAECIARRLRAAGVPEKRIIIENQSKTTYQNFLFSKRKIDKIKNGDLVKVGFCTTNYHLFRAGMLAKEVGFKNVEGTGSKTRWYFWPNAFIREFVGMIWTARKHHLRIIATVAAAVVIVVCTIMN